MMNERNESQAHDDGERDNAWLFGIFYFNKNDKRALVPMKNSKLGKTFNLAHKYSLYFLLAITTLVVVSNLIADFLRT